MRYRTFEVAVGRFNGSFSNSHFSPLQVITSHHRFQSHPSPSKPLAADRVDLATRIISSHYLQPHPLFCLHFPIVSPHSAAASDHLNILTTKLFQMRVPESPGPHQSPPPTSPVIPANLPPSSSVAEPPNSPMQEDLMSPKKNTTPQRTRRQETPPPATATRLRSHITPTKRADAMMLRSKEMRLALLPSAQDPPPPAVESSMHTSNQPEGVPPTTRVIPPTPLQHPGDVVRHEVNYAESRRGRYPSPGDPRQNSVYPEGRPMYDMMMMPPPVDHRDDYTEVYDNPPDNGYHRSPAGSRETSMQPSYQQTGGYQNLHRPPHTHLSPRTDYSSLPAPPRRPPHYPNPYTYYERSAQSSERAYIPSTVGMGRAQRSQSPASTNYIVPQLDGAPSRSPRTAYSNIPGLAGGDQRQAKMLS